MGETNYFAVDFDEKEKLAVLYGKEEIGRVDMHFDFKQCRCTFCVLVILRLPLIPFNPDVRLDR